jgi:hypothetical protein
MSKRQIEREIRRGARLVALMSENLHTVLAALVACDEADLAGSIASTMGDALWRHELTPAKAHVSPEITAFASKMRAELAELGISGPDDLAAWVANLPGKQH